MRRFLCFKARDHRMYFDVTDKDPVMVTWVRSAAEAGGMDVHTFDASSLEVAQETWPVWFLTPDESRYMLESKLHGFLWKNKEE